MPRKSHFMQMLDALRVGNAARAMKRHSVRFIDTTIRPRVLLGWNPLVPEDELITGYRNAIQTLGDPGRLGDYLEFGVSRGTSLACMFHALKRENVSHVRLIGFDSFEGLPPEASTEGWRPGDYRSTEHATRRYLSKKGVDLARVRLVKGWFKDTLTPEARDRLNISKASLIMIDCDIYSASREALWFCEPLIRDQAAIFFDDWGWRSDEGKIGQKEAFEEFLAEFPQFWSEPLPSYLPQARVFLLRRAG